MNEDDERTTVAKQLAKDGHLVAAPDQPGRLFVKQLANREVHWVSLRPVSIMSRW